MRIPKIMLPFATVMLLSLPGPVVLLSLPGSASAAFVHIVLPGESLSSVAATDGLTLSQLAEANGLPPTAELIAGSQLFIPPQGASSGEAISSSEEGGPGIASPSPEEGVPGEASPAPAEGGPSEAQPAPAEGSPSEAQPAPAEDGQSVASLPAAEGGSSEISPSSSTGDGDQDGDDSGSEASPSSFAGDGDQDGDDNGNEATSSPEASSASPATSQPVGQAAEGSPGGPPYPTPQTVSPQQVESIAAANGVPPSLANAIAYMESGFNNALVSSANARGVMQITPGTWSWINEQLAGATPLSPESALENVRAGVLLLHSLLQATNGNEALAISGYYQGLPSALENGPYPSTQQYVKDVEALQQRFGGG
jgi:LysM repeat protein